MLPLVSLGGLFALLFLCWLCSRDRRAISWRLVGVGLLIQGALGFVFLYWSTGNQALQSLGRGVESFLGLSKAGGEFVFNALASYGDVAQAFPQATAGGFIFATQVLPTLIFFSSFMAVLYHLGVMQWVVSGMAWAMARLLGTSGAESLSACANVFVGQTEAPLMVRPFLGRMTMSELHAVMVGGFATIAGGVFALYVGFGIPAGFLMVASVMAVPAGLICSKMLWPESEKPETLGRVVKVETEVYGNVVEAAAGGASDGLKLALNVAAMLIAFLGLVAVLNWGLGLVTSYDLSTAHGHVQGQLLSVQRLLAVLFLPIAAVMGVPLADVPELAQLLGTKIALTELVAYSEMSEMLKHGALDPRTQMIASFALCGFANLGSVAIQIGGLGAMAPERRSDLARLGMRAMGAGALATCMTACMAGVLYGGGGSA